MDLSKDIFLLLAGGLVAFIVNIAINKLQSRGPSIKWRLLPPVFFRSQQLTAFSLSIENIGAKSAKNLRAVVILPDDAIIDSFEIQVSQQAMKYESSSGKNHVEIVFPYFGKGLECILGVLSKGVGLSRIVVSIIGDEDVIGKEKDPQSLTTLYGRTLSLIADSMSLTVVVTIAMMVFIWAGIVTQKRDSYAQQMDIAEVYLQSNQFDKAITEYKKIPEQWWFPTSPRLYYKMAIAFAGKGEFDKSLFFLDKLKRSDSNLFQFAITDSVFDSIRSSRKFVEFTTEEK